MKECLFCKKEFEAKKAHSKFCSDKCRVYFNRVNPKKYKGLTLNQKLDVILDELEKLRGQPKSIVKEINIDDKPKIKGIQYYLNKLKTIDLTSWEETQEFEKEVSDDIFLTVGEKQQIRKAAASYN